MYTNVYNYPSAFILPNPHPKTKQLRKYKRTRQVKKANRLLDKEPLHHDEQQMNEADVDKYIESLQAALKDDRAVGSIVLKWLEIKKKYANKDDDEDISVDALAAKVKT